MLSAAQQGLDLDKHQILLSQRHKRGLHMKNSSFQFKNPALYRLAFSLNEDFDASGPIKMPIQTEVTVTRSENSNNAEVKLELSIRSEENAIPFNVSAIMGAFFEWDDGLKPELIPSLLNKNAPALLLSYLRPLIAQITNSSPYPAYNIPFINFNSSDEETEEDRSSN